MKHTLNIEEVNQRIAKIEEHIQHKKKATTLL